MSLREGTTDRTSSFRWVVSKVFHGEGRVMANFPYSNFLFKGQVKSQKSNPGVKGNVDFSTEGRRLFRCLRTRVGFPVPPGSAKSIKEHISSQEKVWKGVWGNRIPKTHI